MISIQLELAVLKFRTVFLKEYSRVQRRALGVLSWQNFWTGTILNIKQKLQIAISLNFFREFFVCYSSHLKLPIFFSQTYFEICFWIENIDIIIYPDIVWQVVLNLFNDIYLMYILYIHNVHKLGSQKCFYTFKYLKSNDFFIELKTSNRSLIAYYRNRIKVCKNE